ncbi:protein kinase domain-containing protein [Salinigranum halophilum]|uniref:protein kinase domain-containing protein n=1 Tax=Salinigranum halophilum TaxID=2565931 RepID=UPI00115CB708|nr:protein kinase [Salinigranum halophilum]
MARWTADVPQVPDFSTVKSPERFSVSYDDISKEHRIGRGGSSDVYQGSIPTADIAFAIKEPRFQGTINAQTIQAFEDEAEQWSRIDDHDHIVGVLDWGSKPVPWIALDYLDGGSLRDRLDDPEDRIEHIEALWIGICLCRAVRYAHRHGMAHLDLKPSNVLFQRTPADRWDVSKVTDWGLATFLIEHSGSVDGLTPTYAAPEQFDADEYGDPSDFTDIYQLGCLLFELLTGQPPFPGSGAGVMHSHLTEEPPRATEINPDLPPEIDPILIRALSKRQRERQETVVELRQALEAVFDDVSASGAESPEERTPDESVSYSDGHSSSGGEMTADPGTTPAAETSDLESIDETRTESSNRSDEKSGPVADLLEQTLPEETDREQFGRFLLSNTHGTLPAASSVPLRLPVADVYTVDGTAVLTGTVGTGEISVGDEVIVQPESVTGTVDIIEQHHEEIDSAVAGDSVGFTVEGIDKEDVRRGSVVGPADQPSSVPETFVAEILVTEHPSVITAGYTPVFHAHTTQVAGTLELIEAKLDPEDGQVAEQNPDFIQPGEAARVTVEAAKPTVLERFLDFPQLGIFTIRDMGQLVGMGVVREVNGVDAPE